MKHAGRNDPCPCGSGNKYKKYCWEKDGVGISGDMHDDEPLAPERETSLGGLDIHPYAIARMAATPSADVLSKLSKREIEALRAKWSAAKVAVLSTDDIVSRLTALGVDASRPAFLAHAQGRLSAWSLGAEWAHGIEPRPRGHDEDFICLAACELWKRYRPEVPSLEMLDDWVAEGYDLVELRQDARAVVVWQRVWDVVLARLRPSMTTFDAADAVFKCTQYFLNWIQDFVMAAKNAAIKNQACAETGVRVCREVLSRFTAESALDIANFRCDLGSLLFAAGRPDEGEAALMAFIRENPRLAQGYVTLAEELCSPESPSSEFERALRLLETARDLPVEDAGAWDIESEIAEIKKRLAAAAPKRKSRR